MGVSMNLTCLLPLINEMPGYAQLLAALRKGGGQRLVMLDAAKPYLLASLYQELSLPLLVMVAQPEAAKQLQDQLNYWLGDTPIQIFPEADALPYERLAPDPSTIQQRIKTLSILKGVDSQDAPPLVIASAPAMAQKTLSPSDFPSHIISQGMRVDLNQLLAQWRDMGYEFENMVEVPGSFSRRGGILDIYPPNSELPARIELLGNEVESIRLFDPTTQRSLRLVDSIAIVPAREVFSSKGLSLEEIIHSIDLASCEDEVRKKFEHDLTRLLSGDQFDGVDFYTPLFSNGNLIDYLPPEAILILDQPLQIEEAVKQLDAEARDLREEQTARGELPQNFPLPYLTWEAFRTRMKGIERRLDLWSWQGDWDEAQPAIEFSSAPSYGGKLAAFLRDAHEMVEGKRRIIVVSHQARRLSELLEEEDIIAPPLSDIENPPPPGSIALIQGSLAQGWAMDSVTLLTDAELFGFAKKRRQVRRRPMRQAGFLSELAVGDYVVHIEHGIARFGGTTMMSIEGAEREYLILEYAAGDRLYVPADQVDRVGRYIGSSGEPPALTRLGTREWARAKQRVRRAAGELAKELLDLYAAREVISGFAFAPDTTWQEDLEASFPHLETPDQVQAVIEIKEDMERPKPMDRLVCGDVGYGKTEVALRAAFKAVLDGAQVAVLVPTTVLAQQHYTTFKERLSAFPINVEVLSRFRSEREQQEVVDGLKKGTIDICIGTHRLLQKDVAFKNLGLVIIDEEQRFGVTHKEHLKQMRKEIDVLTLTATPIPRTLHMSLAGVRDMSTMETPPEERLPIKTYIAEYDEDSIRKAVLRELDRNGQVFFVHNRVHSIRRIASRLAELVPEAEIAIGHGQMPEEQLEHIMLDFSQGKIDVLVCTTIIESGLDIPNVNTIIVNDADRMGLAQLYQLRGRVGRGTNRAYAYFLYARGKQLTPKAQRRLKTIFQATELGAGFRIAMRDLEIRGAGNILGAAQSGHIGAVGFDLYCRVLAEAVEELRAGRIDGKRAVSLQPPAIDLPLSTRIPEDYVSDLDTRLILYQRLAKLGSTRQVDEIAEELEDRFGPIPQQVSNLLYAVKVKIHALEAGVRSIAVDAGQLVVKMAEGKRVEKALESALGDGVKAGTNQVRLNLKRLGDRWQEALSQTLQAMGGE